MFLKLGAVLSEDLVDKVDELKRGAVRRLVSQRVREFRELGRKGNKEWFSELCFCILTANSTAKLGVKIQRELRGRGFLELSEAELREKLRQLGHRFPNTRARFIVEARRFGNIKTIIKNFKDERQAREWLQRNIKGIGWKESSHFLRNVGFTDVAILDRHVLAVLREHKLIDEAPRSLACGRYLWIEEKLRKFARGLNISLGELDLYLWYMKTGDIQK
jgi:N-glycosylase/DNA lyase